MLEIKNFSRDVGWYIKTTIILLAVYIAALTVAYKIPTKYIEDNIKESCIRLEKEGLYFSLSDSWIGTYDNFTDALYINTMVYADTSHPFMAMVQNNYACGEDDGYDPIKWLRTFLGGGKYKEVEYSRYWIGSIAYLRPLFCFLNLSQMRQIFLIIAMTLFVFIAISIYKTYEDIYQVFSFAIPCILMFLPIQCMGLAYFTDIIMFLIGMCVVCICSDTTEDKKIAKIFYIIGSLAFYLNYFSYPFISIGMPLTYQIARSIYKGKSCRQCLRTIICVTFSWCLGFGLTMLMKQGLAFLMLGSENGISQALFRMGSELSLIDRFGVIFGSLCYWIKAPYIICALCIFIYGLIMIRKNRRTKYQIINQLRASVPHIILFAFSFVWILVVAQHSIHFFATNVFIIAIYNLLLIWCRVCFGIGTE